MLRDWPRQTPERLRNPLLLFYRQDMHRFSEMYSMEWENVFQQLSALVGHAAHDDTLIFEKGDSQQ